MTLSMHAATAPIFIRMLGNVDRWLDKAQAHADARGSDSGELLGLRLAPDMLPFAAQVRIASDIARLTMSRLGGLDFPRHADDETTLADLQQRVRSSIAFVQGVGADQVNGTEAAAIVLPQRSGGPLHFTGQTFLQAWALPNFFFHTTMSYALLRQAGLDVGKADYLGTV